MIWVEHDVMLVSDLADRIMVLGQGTKVKKGGATEVFLGTVKGS